MVSGTLSAPPSISSNPQPKPPTSALTPSQAQRCPRDKVQSPPTARARYSDSKAMLGSSEPINAGAARPPARPSSALGAPKRSDRPMASAVTAAIPSIAANGLIR